MRVSVLILLGFFLLATSASAAPAPPSALDDFPPIPALSQPINQSDRDRIELSILLTEGKTHLQKEEYAEALRCYQRALRLDERSPAIVQAIVALAAHLNRNEVAARYALIDVPLKDCDPMMLRGLAVNLTAEGEYDQAITIYEKALAACDDEKTPAAEVILRIELGRLCFLKEKYARAAECFDLIARAMDNPEQFKLDEQITKALLDRPGPTYQLMGECFLAADQLDKAQAAFQKAADNGLDAAATQYNLARIKLKTGKPTEALKALDAAFAEHLTGRGDEPYKLLSKVLDKLGRKEELIDRLQKLHDADPGNQPLGYFLAEQLGKAGATDQAETLYRKLIDAEATPTGYKNLTDLYVESKRFDLLLALLGESVEKIGVVETLDGVIQPLAAKPETVEAVLKIAGQEAMRSSKKIERSHALAAALLALQTEKYDKAGLFFDLALGEDKNQDAEIFLIWGVGLLSAERSADAAKVFQRAITADLPPEKQPAFQFYLAGALALEGRVEEALAAARIAAEINKYSARYCGRPAWILYYCGRNKEAAEAYRKLIDEFDADHSFAETRQVMREARMALSNLSAIEGDTPQAEEWLEQVLDELPDDPGALNDLGYLWIDQGKNLHRAERMIRRAVAAEPENTAYRDSLGWFLYRTGKFAQAVAELEKAAVGEPGGTVLEHLGDAYQKTGQQEKAHAAWTKAAEEYRKEKELEKEKNISAKILKIEK